MASNNIELSIKVNAETGQLEILGSKFEALNTKAKEASGSFLGLSGEAAKLAKQMLPFATGAGALLFFKSAVEGAEEQNESLRRLRFSLEASGQSWDKNKESIDQWANTIAASTRFSDGEALGTLDKMVRVTGSLAQAQSASQLAMGLSVQSGKDLGTSTQLVNDLLNGNERALIQVRREFGSFVEGATTAQEVLDILGEKLGKAAVEEDSLTRRSAELANNWSQLKDRIGNALIPAISSLLDFVLNFRRQVTELRIVVENEFTGILARIGGALTALGRLMSGDIGGARQAFSKISEQTLAIAAHMNDELRTLNQKAAVEDDALKRDRLIVKQRLTEEEIRAEREKNQKLADEETQRFQTWAQKREEQKQRVIQIEQEIASNITSINNQTLRQKEALLNQEIAARRQKINKEISDETIKRNLLIKLEQERIARSIQLTEADRLTKFNAALETVDLAAQTLGILNSLGDKHNAGEVNRAKAILGLEKAIAIARAIAAAMAAPPGVSQAIAAAQVALIAAQFAQQFRAIDQAQSAFKSGQSSVSVSSGLPGGGTLSQTFGGGGGSPTFIGGGGGGGGGGVVAAGGGSGQVQINLGGVNVNIDITRLSIDNVGTVMNEITERVRRGVVEGTQLALALKNSADKNANLAG
jgi:flagellar biosynthesis GTPase FlhF